MSKTTSDITGKDLTDLRNQHNFTQAGLAQKLGKSLSLVQKWEQGDSIPRLDVLYELSKLYNVEFVVRNKVRHEMFPEKKSDQSKSIA